MTHPHERRFDIYEEREQTFCRFVCSCGITMEGQEVLKRLNATERLPGTLRLRAFAEHILEDPPLFIEEVSIALLAYAAALEGEDA